MLSARKNSHLFVYIFNPIECQKSGSITKINAFGERKMPAKQNVKKKRQSGTSAGTVSLTLTCEWAECTDVFTNMVDFTSHVSKHLGDVLCGLQKQGIDDLELACQWRDCHQDVGNFVAMLRHIYFHAYHIKLKSIGVHVLMRNKDVGQCQLDSSSRNMIPELPDNLQCAWHHCGEVFQNPDYFYHHIANHCETYPEGNKVPGGCRCLWEGCRNLFNSKHKLKEHLRSHTQEKVVACPGCGFLFANNCKLLDHIKRQQDVNFQSYECSHCNKRCPTERLLRDHMRHHVNHYKCPVCDMTCPSPSALKDHIKFRHTDERSHICEKCGHRTKNAADLRKHLESHSDQAYKCHVEGCEYVTRTFQSLTHHFKIDHQQQDSGKFVCHVCNHVYSRGARLTVHLKKDHNFRWPAGHKRFRYKEHEDGRCRLQTVRYESIELTEQMLTEDLDIGEDRLDDAAATADNLAKSAVNTQVNNSASKLTPNTETSTKSASLAASPSNKSKRANSNMTGSSQKGKSQTEQVPVGASSVSKRLMLSPVKLSKQNVAVDNTAEVQEKSARRKSKSPAKLVRTKSSNQLKASNVLAKNGLNAGVETEENAKVRLSHRDVSESPAKRRKLSSRRNPDEQVTQEGAEIQNKKKAKNRKRSSKETKRKSGETLYNLEMLGEIALQTAYVDSQTKKRSGSAVKSTTAQEVSKSVALDISAPTTSGCSLQVAVQVHCVDSSSEQPPPVTVPELGHTNITDATEKEEQSNLREDIASMMTEVVDSTVTALDEANMAASHLVATQLPNNSSCLGHGELTGTLELSCDSIMNSPLDLRTNHHPVSPVDQPPAPSKELV